MALSSGSGSTILYESTEVDRQDVAKPTLGEIILAKIDSVVEYPGSRKGDSGHWVLIEWVDSKIKGLVEGNGQERR